MKDENLIVILGITTTIVVFVFLMGIAIGLNTGNAKAQQDAIKAKVGEYYLDENHEKQFRFINYEDELFELPKK